MNQIQKRAIKKAERLFPHTFAKRASMGRWKAFNYLIYISQLIASAIIEGGAKIILQAPPRHGKSELISHWTPFWYLHMFPRNMVILTSYEANVASRWGRKVRDEIAYNPHSGLKINQASSARADWEIEEYAGGMITAGTGGAITGRGGNLIIVDDPIKNYEEANSAAYQEKMIEWWESTLYTRLEPNGSIIMLLTRWNKKDLAGYLQSAYPDEYVTINFPAFAEEGDLIGRNVGDPLCPERYDSKALMSIKGNMSSTIFNGMYQGHPSSIEGEFFKRSWWKYYDVLPPMDEVIAAADLTFKETKKGSFVVIQIWGRVGSNVYLIWQFRARVDFIEQTVQLSNVRNVNARVTRIIIEDAANAQAAISVLRGKVHGLIAVKPQGDKVTRAMAIQHIPESGSAYLPNPALPNNKWVQGFIDELADFPKGENDDQVDTASLALTDIYSRLKKIGEIFFGQKTSTFKNS
jgi:predicted phage terminase large subunit-like protein